MNNEPQNLVKLPSNWKKIFLGILAAWSLLALVGSAYAHGLSTLHGVALGVILLGLGFKITEVLISVLTGVRSANASAIGLIFLAKIGWWALLFAVSRFLPSSLEMPLAMGIGAFLLSVLSLVVYLFGMPKISAPKDL